MVHRWRHFPQLVPFNFTFFFFGKLERFADSAWQRHHVSTLTCCSYTKTLWICFITNVLLEKKLSVGTNGRNYYCSVLDCTLVWISDKPDNRSVTCTFPWEGQCFLWKEVILCDYKEKGRMMMSIKHIAQFKTFCSYCVTCPYTSVYACVGIF